MRLVRNTDQPKSSAAAIWEMDYRIITDWPSADDTEKTIKQLGYLFVSYKMRDKAWWHCVVLYGVHTSVHDEPTYLVMDPEFGKDDLRRTKSTFFPAGTSSRVGTNQDKCGAGKSLLPRMARRPSHGGGSRCAPCRSGTRGAS